jgi:hypothetical protein
MKHILIFITALLVFASCKDFLDVTPEGSASEKDIYKTAMQAENYVLRMYHPVPNRYHMQYMPDWLAGGDIMSGFYGSVRYFSYKALLYDMETPSSTYFKMWSTTAEEYPEGASEYSIFPAIRTCYNVIDNLPSVPDITEDQLNWWTGEAYFLIAYYHQTLLEYYGPTVLVKREIPFDSSDPEEIYPTRAPYDECVDFIIKKYDEAVKHLPISWSPENYGRATIATALGQKARLLLYAASPLVNGNSQFYANFKNPDGTHLIPQTYDREKWKKAMDAAKEAIDFCEANGYGLYESSKETDPMKRGIENYHTTFVGPRGSSAFFNTKEYLFSMNGQGSTSYNNRNMAPRIGYTSYNSSGFRGYVFPTWDCLHTYYTVNGLPLDVDPLTKDLDLYTVAPGDSTALLNRNREPRFYASIGFDRGSYRVNGGVITLKCRFGEMQQNDQNRTHEYQSDNGYYVQKWISDTDSWNASSSTGVYNKYAYPYLRVAELYLSYAEADFEYNGSLSEQSLIYLNKVRKRAGLPNFEDSWALVGGIPSDEQTLRNVIRQERTIEFMMEGRRFHDIRRWKIAEEEMTRPWYAWDQSKSDQKGFYTVVPMYESPQRTFITPKTYWLAIPNDQLLANPNLVQNPGYGAE